MSKISLEQAKKLLKELVPGVEVVEDDKQADKDVDVSAIIDETREAIQADASIDPATLEDAGKKATGQLLGTLRSQMAKTFGGSQRDYIGSDEKPLTIQEMVALAKTKFDERTGAQAKDWETERSALIEEHEAALLATKTEYETQVNTERNKYIERDISAATLSMLEKIPRKGGDLADDADTVLYKARQQYDIKFDETKKELQFFVKGENKPASVKPADFAKQFYEKTGRLATDTRHIEPAKAKQQGAPMQGIIQQPLTNANGLPDTMAHIADWANGD